MLPMEIHCFQSYFTNGDAAMCLAALWGGGEPPLSVRLRSWQRAVRPGPDAAGLLGVLSGAACGAKNTSIFLTPLYGLAAIKSGGRLVE